MTIIQMQYFEAVCRHRNYTKAAEELHVTQPAISQAMRDLEKECGVALFLRDKNALQVSEEGHILLEEVSLVLEQYGKLMHVVRDLSLNRNYIRIGLSTLSGNLVYPHIRKHYHDRYPDIQVMSLEESTKKQFEMLDANQLDAIITIRRAGNEAEQRRFNDRYGAWPMLDTSLMFCVHKSHPLAGNKSVTLAQIAGQPLVLLRDNYNQTARLKAMFDEAGLSLNVIHYTNQMYTVERFVENNIAAGFLPGHTARRNPDIAGLDYQQGAFEQVQLFWRKDRFQFKATKQFIDLVKELYPK